MGKGSNEGSGISRRSFLSKAWVWIWAMVVPNSLTNLFGTEPAGGEPTTDPTDPHHVHDNNCACCGTWENPNSNFHLEDFRPNNDKKPELRTSCENTTLEIGLFIPSTPGIQTLVAEVQTLLEHVLEPVKKEIPWFAVKLHTYEIPEHISEMLTRYNDTFVMQGFLRCALHNTLPSKESPITERDLMIFKDRFDTIPNKKQVYTNLILWIVENWPWWAATLGTVQNVVEGGSGAAVVWLRPNILEKSTLALPEDTRGLRVKIVHEILHILWLDHEGYIADNAIRVSPLGQKYSYPVVWLMHQHANDGAILNLSRSGKGNPRTYATGLTDENWTNYENVEISFEAANWPDKNELPKVITMIEAILEQDADCVTTGTEDAEQDAPVKIGPNPTQWDVTITFQNESFTWQVSVINTAGQQMRTDQMSGEYQVVVPLNDYPAWVYYVRMFNTKTRIKMTQKIVKQ